MIQNQLGTTDMQITRVGIGAWAMGGGDWLFSWGPQDDADSIAAIHAGIDAGINWIDTAPVYGLGHSERVIGKAIAGMKNRPYIFTKCGRVWDEARTIGKRLSAESIRSECEASLRRLGVDRIDLYQIHWPEPDEQVEEGWSTLAALQKEGKVRNIGVSNFSVAQLKRANAIAPVATLQPPYSLLSPEIEADILPYCQQHDIGVIVYSPMKCGLLAGKMTRERVENFPPDDWRRRNPHFQEPLLTRNLAIADVLTKIGSRQNRTAGEVAIAWCLRHPAVTAAIVGIRNAFQVAGIIGADRVDITEGDLEEIAIVM